MPKEERECLKKYLSKSKVYCEFGSGGSTFYAIDCKNINKIYSIESDVSWVDHLLENKKIQENVESGRLQFIVVDLKCKPLSWGYPGEDCSKESILKYSNSFTQVPYSKVDTILVDGRFRVACMLKMFYYLPKNTTILVDDFWIRPEYKVILEYYNTIDMTGRMGIFNKNVHINKVPMELIAKYEEDKC